MSASRKPQGERVGDPVGDQPGLALPGALEVGGLEIRPDRRVSEDRFVGGLVLGVEHPQRRLGEPLTVLPEQLRRCGGIGPDHRDEIALGRGEAVVRRLHLVERPPRRDDGDSRHPLRNQGPPHANAYGPPPEKPTTPTSSSPRSSAIEAIVSATTDNEATSTGLAAP
jgi:hypothetical protein